MEKYDMVMRPDEPYYARQYLHWILPELSSRYDNRKIQILDLGCGQGRLSLPLAGWCASGGGRVTGIDFVSSAIEKARGYAAQRSLSNVTFEQNDLLDFIQKKADGSADAILLIEVTFILPSYREVLAEIFRVLRPKGLAFIAFRSQYYNLLHTIRGRNWDGAKMALEQWEGHLFGGSSWFSWQTPEEIHQLMDESGLHLLDLRGIGISSGIEGDPLVAIARPSELSPKEQENLMKIECTLAEHYAACCRYILATAEKSL